MTEPAPLAVEQLLPLAVALEYRQRQCHRGQTTLRYPLPPCPACRKMPDEITTGRSPHFFTTGILFEPCGHTFTATDEVTCEATKQACAIVDQEENQPVGQRPDLRAEHAPPASTSQTESPEFVIALHEDDGTLIVGVRPDGSIVQGPNYRPDEAAAEFWDAVTRAAHSASPWTGQADD
ncbi:hypothetical protein ACWY4P_41050 [Streptomyces sp. LZ34]